MKKFDVEITETLQRKVSVEAASQEDAERMVTQAWNNQDYVLDSGDFTGVDFKTVGEHELAETRTMNVLLVQPNAYPKKISVGTELEDLQAMVGGDIEARQSQPQMHGGQAQQHTHQKAQQQATRALAGRVLGIPKAGGARHG